MFKIKTLNAISDVIHEELSAEQYVISPEEPVPEGILVQNENMATSLAVLSKHLSVQIGNMK